MTASSRLFQRSVILNGLFALEGGSTFLLDVTLAATLGVGAQSDILYAAWSLPLTIGRGAFQSLTNSLIGLFSEADNDADAYSQAISVIGALSLMLALTMALTSRFWFPLSMAGATPDIRSTGIPLAAILSGLIMPLALAETQRAIYYRMDKNYYPSTARVLGALASIIAILLAATSQNSLFVAIGLVFGAVVEMVLGFTGLMGLGWRFKFSWPERARLQRMARVVGLPMLGQGVLIGASVAERAIASYLGPGTVTAVTYANRIFAMMERFTFRGFIISTIQSYTTKAATNWRRDMRLLMLLSIPIMIVFAVLPTPLITIIFERGRFTSESTQMVAMTLRFYAFAAPIIAFNRIPYALTFAKNRSRIMLLYAVIFAIILIGIEIILISSGVGLPAFGVAYILAVFCGTYWLYSRIMTDAERITWSVDEMLRLAGVAIMAFAGTALIVLLLDGQVIDPTRNAWITALVGGVASLLLTGIATCLLRLPEGEWLVNMFKKVKR